MYTGYQRLMKVFKILIHLDKWNHCRSLFLRDHNLKHFHNSVDNFVFLFAHQNHKSDCNETIHSKMLYLKKTFFILNSDEKILNRNKHGLSIIIHTIFHSPKYMEKTGSPFEPGRWITIFCKQSNRYTSTFYSLLTWTAQSILKIENNSIGIHSSWQNRILYWVFINWSWMFRIHQREDFCIWTKMMNSKTVMYLKLEKNLLLGTHYVAKLTMFYFGWFHRLSSHQFHMWSP